MIELFEYWLELHHRENIKNKEKDMAILGAFVKQPREVEVYSITFSKDMGEGDYIKSLNAFVEPSNELLVRGFHINEDRVTAQVWLEKGTINQVYKVTVTASLNSGRVLEDEFKVKIKEF